MIWAWLLAVLVGQSIAVKTWSSFHSVDNVTFGRPHLWSRTDDLEDLDPGEEQGDDSSWLPFESLVSNFSGADSGHRIAASPHNRVLEEDDVEPEGWEQLDEKVVLCRRLETHLVGDNGGNLISLRQHSVMCGEKEFLAQWRVTRANTHNKYKVIYKCCSAVPELGACSEKKSPLRSSHGGNLLALHHHSAQCSGNSLMKGWQLDTKGADMQITTTCCSLAGKAKLGNCKDSVTQGSTASRDVRRLVRHDVKCSFPTVMTRWQMQFKGRSQFFISFSCCAAGEVEDLPTGNRRTCRWVGDPHFVTFDGGRHDTTRPGSGQTFWVVKSKDVKIQSYYEGSHANSPALTRGVVVFGRFLRGHKLIVKKDMPAIRPGAALLEGASNYSLMRSASIVTWDDEPVQDGQSIRVNGLCNIERRGNRVTASLPLGVQLEVKQYGGHQDQTLMMARALGGQKGQCGNNNGNQGDDSNLEGRYPVAREDNMFIKVGTGHGDTEAPKELSDCRAERRRVAEERCRKRFRGDKFLQDFLNMCIYDACFTNEGEMFAAADQDAELEARAGMEAQLPRSFMVDARITGDRVPDACAGGGKTVGKITSMDEQKGVMEAIANTKETSSNLWIGGRFQGGRWVWNDGQPICGFHNWDSKVKRKLLKPPHNHLCISKRTGKWTMCSHMQQLNVVCMTPKVYAIQDFQGPVGARSACAPTHDLAMPKSAVEQDALFKSVQQHSAKKSWLWLGAAYRNERWEWDDGSKVCYSNWAEGEPKIPAGETGQLWMVMSAETGKWKVMSGYKGYHSVPCETKMQSLPCVMSKLSPTELALTVIPGEMNSNLRGHCYYMGKGGETCHETCWNQIDGYCDEKGLKKAANTKGICKMILTRFGGNLGKNSQTQRVIGDTGCSYMDMGLSGLMTKTQVVVAKSSTPPSCEARTTSKSHHRLCACKDDTLLVYPLNHVVTTGDTVRVCGKGYHKKKKIKVHLKGINTAATAALLEGASEASEVISWLRWAETPPPRPAMSWQGWAETPLQTAAMDWQSWGQPSPLRPVARRMGTTSRNTLVQRPQAQPLSGARWLDLRSSEAVQSSEAFGAKASRAIDGNTDGRFQRGMSCTHTAREANPWWSVKLQQSARIVGVRVTNRADCCGSRLSPFLVYVDSQLCGEGRLAEGQNALYVACENKDGLLGNTVKIQHLKSTPSVLSLCEVEVAAAPVAFEQEAQQKDPTLLAENEKQVAADGSGAEQQKDVIDIDNLLLEDEKEVSGSASASDAEEAETDVAEPAEEEGSTQQPGVISWGEEQKQTMTGTLEIALIFDPVQRVVTKQYFTNGKEKVETSVPWWDLGNRRLPWCLDFEAAEKVWKVRVNGKSYTELAIPRSMHKHITHVNTNVNSPHFMLIPPEPLSPTSPLSLNSVNGCLDHPFKATRPVMAFSFVVRPRSLKGSPCIRCESRPIDQGSHLYFHENKIRFVVEGASPRIQTFRWKFQLHKRYKVQVVYISTENVVELYMNDLRVAMLQYKKAPPFQLKPGMLGCATASKEDGRRFDGQIVDFVATEIIPNTRPRYDKCSGEGGLGVQCPDGFILKDHPSRIECGGSICSKNDVDTCCQAQMKCDHYECLPDTLKRHDASSLTCKTEQCLNDECCTTWAVCAGFTCPKEQGKVLRQNPHKITCAGVKCLEELDVEACCEDLGKCSSFTCPEGYSLVHNADQLHCTDTECSSTNFRHCCAENSKCAVLSCRQGYVSKAQAATIPCPGHVCQASDHDLCCDKIAPCSSYSCEDGYVLRSDPSLMCAGRECTAHDAQTCCVKKKTCQDMVCPPLWTHKADAADVQCEDENCKNTEFTKCCEELANCANYSCPAHHVLRPSAQHLHCKGTTCTSADFSTCCQPLAACNTTMCQTGQVHVHNASVVMCDGPHCTIKDLPKCCVSQGICTSMQCPSGYVHRQQANSTFCHGDRCIDEDWSLCCDAKAPCTNDVCERGYTLRADVKERCQGTTCGPVDHNTCCVEQGTCATMKCPADSVPRPHARRILCLGTNCTSDRDALLCCDKRAACEPSICPAQHTLVHNATSKLCQYAKCTGELDAVTCCVPQGKCDSMTCPAGHVHRPDAHNRFCAGAACHNTSTADVFACCTEVAKCSSYKCPTGMLSVGNASGVLCKHSTCSDRDIPQCCMSKNSCALFNCPKGTGLRSDASMRLCEDIVCKETDWRQCCVEDGRCASLSCAAGMVLKKNASSILCPGQTCSVDDNSLCCEPAGPCVPDICPSDMVPRNSQGLTCSGPVCGLQDADMCCKKKGRCDTYTCPPNYALKANAQSLLCNDADCIETDFNNCCDPVARCNSLMCPVGFIAREMAETISCRAQHCTSADRDTCCNRRADCRSMHCPAGYALIHNASAIHCRGAQCHANELSQCCTHKRSCNSLACPQGFTHRQGAGELTCDSDTCTQADVKACCEPLASCSNFHCPLGMVARAGAGVCLDRKCTMEECCVQPATCDSMRCPAGKTHVASAGTVLCSGVQCEGALDTAKCCTPLGSCHDFQCPEPGYVLHGDAKRLHCSSAMCTQADYQICCALKSHCTTLPCPAGFVLKENASLIICAGDGCTADDRDTCCNRRAPCSSYAMCPAGSVRTKDPSAFCRGSKCTKEDQGMCCDLSATCDMFECPRGYTLRENAGNLWCNGRSCKNTDFHTCCVESQMCSNFTCPAHFLHRPDAASLHCSGRHCEDPAFIESNRQLCCEAKATCDSMVCPAEKALVQNAATTACAGHLCTETDSQLCCVDAGDCRTYRCPPSMVPRVPHPDVPLFCESSECTARDRGTCCVDRAPCDQEACPTGYILRDDHHGVLCANSTCDPSVDSGSCCLPRGTCASFACPLGYGLKPEASSQLCHDAACKEIDYRVCCQRWVHCDAFSCPEGHVHHTGAADIPCGTQNCTDADKDVCCMPVAKCSSYVCPWGFTKKAHAAELSCKWGSCGDGDVLTCCHEETMCSSYECPDSMVQRPHAHNIECTQQDCSTTSANICCAKQAFCESLACPVGMVHRSNASFVICSGNMTCTLADVSDCCEVAATCNTMECPSDYLPVDYQELVTCSSARCSEEEDLKTCCVKRGTCGAYHCPSGYALRQAHKELVCADTLCNTTDANTRRCCDEQAMCSTFSCPGSWRHRKDSDSIECSDVVCRDVDRSRCCEVHITVLPNSTTSTTTTSTENTTSFAAWQEVIYTTTTEAVHVTNHTNKSRDAKSSLGERGCGKPSVAALLSSLLLLLVFQLT